MSLFQRVESVRNPGESKTGFCKRAKIDYRTFQDIERGSQPRLDTLVRMSEALGLSFCWLATGEGPQGANEFGQLLTEWQRKKRCRETN